MPPIWKRGLWLAIGGGVGAVLFGGGSLLVHILTGTSPDPAKILSIAVAGAIVVGILVGAGRPGRTR